VQARKDFDLTASELGLGRFRTRLQLYQAKKMLLPSNSKKERER